MVKKIFAKSYIAICLLVMYAPIFVLMVFSFTDATNVGSWTTFSFNLYGKLFTDSETMIALGNTILIAVVSAIVATILGTLGAIGVFYSKRKVKNAIEMVGQIPVVNPEIVIALSLTILFVFIGAKFNFLTLLIGHVTLTIPFIVLSVKPKLMQMDPNIYEAALDLGATPHYALWKVVFPEILPGVFSGFMLAITLSLDDFIITAFTRNNSFQTLSTLVQSKIKKGPIPTQLRALTTIIFVVALIILIAININSKRKLKKQGGILKNEKN